MEYEKIEATTQPVNLDVVRATRGSGLPCVYELRDNLGSAQLWAKYTIQGEERECHLLSLVPGLGIALQPNVDAEVFPVDDRGYVAWCI
jgi:hypothetical protein